MFSDKTIRIYERGKARVITPIHVKDRVIQKVLCDYALVPVLARTLIHDNGASLEGKGVMFSRNRMWLQLRKAVGEYGADFYVLSFDFKSFFDSVSHKTCEKLLRRYILDESIVRITMEIVKAPHRIRILRLSDPVERDRQLQMLENNELCGICLGSQVSQILALIIANDLDHYIKDKCRRKYYVRYMDDGVILGKTREELQDLLEGMREVCDQIGLVLHETKTRIIHVRRGFRFLKVRYYVNSHGEMIRRLTHKGIVRMRRKLKKFYKLYRNGELQPDDAYNSLQSWLAHSRVARSYTTTKHMLRLYYSLFDGYKISNQYKRRVQNEFFQTDRWFEYRWACQR